MAISSSPCPASDGENIIAEWNLRVIDMIRTDTQGPTLSSRNLAIINTAAFDAVNSIDGKYQPYRFRVSISSEACREAAAMGAAHLTVTSLYPSASAKAEGLLRLFIQSHTNCPSVATGFDLGREVARRALESRKDDGTGVETFYVPTNAPGNWRRTPPAYRPPLTPRWGKVTPFALPETETFVPGPPPSLGSPAYADALNEVKAIGSRQSTVRTKEESEIALFWSDFSYTSMPPGHWHEITTEIARSKELTLIESARLFALLSIAQADSAIVCWATKYRYNFWRPITAIQRADQDGNALTEADREWDHFLAAPPFPSYTSGHSTFSKASAEILTRFFGTDKITFSARSDSLPGVVRSFESLAECADEIGRSRIYGGIHFKFDDEAGKEVGRRIGEYVFANHLLPLKTANEPVP